MDFFKVKFVKKSRDTQLKPDWQLDIIDSFTIHIQLNRIEFLNNNSLKNIWGKKRNLDFKMIKKQELKNNIGFEIAWNKWKFDKINLGVSHYYFKCC